MKKFLKRAALLILGIILAVGAFIGVYMNSEKFSTDVAYLTCETHNAGGAISVEQAIAAFGRVGHARLRHDWIRDRIILNWVGDEDEYIDGLQPSQILKIKPLVYSGYDYEEQRFRSFDRETLDYQLEYRKFSSSSPEWWMQRRCIKVKKYRFEKIRKQLVDDLKAKQQI